MGTIILPNTGNNDQQLNTPEYRLKAFAEVALEKQEKNIEELMNRCAQDPEITKILLIVHEIQDAKRIEDLIVLLKIHLDNIRTTNKTIEDDGFDMTFPGAAGAWARGLGKRLEQMGL